MFALVIYTNFQDPFLSHKLLDEWHTGPVSRLAYEIGFRNLSRIYLIYIRPSEHPSHPGKSVCGTTDILALCAGQSGTVYSAIHNVIFDLTGRFYFDQSPIEDQPNLFLTFSINLTRELTRAIINFKQFPASINLRDVLGLPVGALESAYNRREVHKRVELEAGG